jgi:hypothetical protein
MHLRDLPKIGGAVAIVACGDGELMRCVQTVVAAAGAEDVFLKTYEGGTHFLFRRDAAALRVELAAAQNARGRSFSAIIDLQHLDCVAYGFRGASVPIPAQLAAIIDSQDKAARYLRKVGVGLTIYQLVAHPSTGFFYRD